MKTSTILIVSFLFSSILMTSCYYDCDESKLPRNTYLLPNDAKDAFAYNGNDTIRFLKNNKDTIVFIGSEIDSFYVERPRILECDGEIAIYEEYEIIFTSLETSQIKINLQYPKFAKTGVSIEYGLSPFIFFLSTEKSNSLPDFDSLKINGKYHYDIFMLSDFNATLYYTKENGIIKIITNTEKLEIL